MIGIELLPFAFPGREGLQILYHPGKPFGLFGNGIGIGRRVIKCTASLLPGVEGFPDSGEFGRSARMIIKKLELVGGLQKRLVRVLSVNVDERFTELPQLRSSNGYAVHPGPGASLDIHRAANHQHVVPRFELVGRKPPAGIFRRQELRHDIRALSAFSHDACVRPASKNKLQRIDENGLPRPGFTRQNGKALTNVQAQGLDDHKVSQA